jgi:hypothetical protein
MATKAQIAANRQNAQKSTGPKTAEGKAVVSQNALKHGLFAHEAVIHGESQAQYGLHREALLAEWRPVGPTECMLAERIVSLAWRVRRAERMGNEAADCMILREMVDGPDDDLDEGYRQVNGISPDDPEGCRDALALGRIATKRWSNNPKLIERLFMHERRIESSLLRTMLQLKKLQTIRRIEHDDAAERSVAQAPAAKNRSADFAKQSQFALAWIDAKPLSERNYDGKPSAVASQNKANQACHQGGRTGQFQTPAASGSNGEDHRGRNIT